MIEKLSADVLRQHKGVSFVGVTTCFFVHDGAGNIFMAKRSQRSRDEKGRWECGGGGLKWGVAAVENAIREIKEEYNAEAASVEFLGYRDIFRSLEDDTKTHWLGLDFAVLVKDKSKVKISEEDMFDDGGWFPLSSPPSPLHSQHLIMVRWHGEKLRKAVGLAG